ncbi:unnamed protein product, partial [Gulo gulo]
MVGPESPLPQGLLSSEQEVAVTHLRSGTDSTPLLQSSLFRDCGLSPITSLPHPSSMKTTHFIQCLRASLNFR